MENTRWLEQEDDWQVVLSFLPVGWRPKAKELGALRRCRKFDNEENLLRVESGHDK